MNELQMSLFRALFDLISDVDQDRLLSCYFRRMGELPEPFQTASRGMAVHLMMDNCEDDSQVGVEHLTYCLRRLFVTVDEPSHSKAPEPNERNLYLDFLEMLWSITSFDVRKDVLKGYVESFTEECREPANEDEEKRAYQAMLDNSADSTKQAAAHIGRLLDCLIRQI